MQYILKEAARARDDEVGMAERIPVSCSDSIISNHTHIRTQIIDYSTKSTITRTAACMHVCMYVYAYRYTHIPLILGSVDCAGRNCITRDAVEIEAGEREVLAGL